MLNLKVGICPALNTQQGWMCKKTGAYSNVSLANSWPTLSKNPGTASC